jgi:hypothetical protein
MDNLVLQKEKNSKNEICFDIMVNGTSLFSLLLDHYSLMVMENFTAFSPFDEKIGKDIKNEYIDKFRVFNQNNDQIPFWFILDENRNLYTLFSGKITSIDESIILWNNFVYHKREYTGEKNSEFFLLFPHKEDETIELVKQKFTKDEILFDYSDRYPPKDSILEFKFEKDKYLNEIKKVM